MAYKVLVVDDSNFFQQRLKQIINEHPELQVVGVAANGQQAIDMDAELKPDIISMDYEMPLMDGVTAIRTILSRRKVPIVMFSSMTYEGAAITLQALEAGAVDFIPKNFAEVSRDSDLLKKRLHEKLITFARASKPQPQSQLQTPVATRSSAAVSRPQTTPTRTIVSPPASKAGADIKLLAIGASTGGPVALTDVITRLPENFPLPVVIVQHMPENFTRVFAERLHRQAKLSVKEAENGDQLEQGMVLVAPGGKQLMFERSGSAVRILEADDRVQYKPSVDIMFASAANVFGNKVLGIVLTGMGADGCEGARLIKGRGGEIWSQDESTCVVYGMPAAVAKARLTDAVLPIEEFAVELSKRFC